MAILSCIVVGLALAAQRGIVSPEVHSDRTVTFRFKDSGAAAVMLNLEGADSTPMVKDATGVWSYTTKALVPDLYGYSFAADGETRLDPNNSLQKPNLIWPSNMVLVPGVTPELWEVQNVPHGTLHHHFYKSQVIGDERDYFVYTPPAYRSNASHGYPVLYLFHGFSDTACGWTEVGKAHVILDNLIAQGKAKPMIVVMTLGYGVPDFASPHGPGFRTPSVVLENYTKFRDALLTEVLPQVQAEYRVATQPENRAVAGLSMGGAESLFVGLNNLDKFSYIGAFSSGGLSGDFSADFPGLSADTANHRLKHLMISCGTEDGLITFNRGLVKWLKGKDVHLTAVETPGRHAWMVWRRNLAEYASLLFK